MEIPDGMITEKNASITNPLQLLYNYYTVMRV